MKEEKATLKSSDVVISSPLGRLGFSLIDDKLHSIEFLPQTKARNPHLKKKLQPVLDEIAAYFVNPQHHFHFKAELQGTSFQKSVWKALQQIPCGTTVSYQDLAQKLKTSARAIGNACRKNPLPILIPCHRVVAKNGLGGFCGTRQGKFLQIKQALLEHELRSLEVKSNLSVHAKNSTRSP